MKSWSENIRFSQPLRDVEPAGAAVVQITGEPPALARASAGELQASYERGRIDGEKALSELLMKQRTELHALAQGALTALKNAVPNVVRETETMLVSLALEVAQKLVSDMPISVSMIEAAIRDALAQVEGTAQFTVRLHPADLELLRHTESPILSTGDGSGEFRFLGSPEVTRGGCIVQTRFGTVDARRETKFDLLKRSLVAS